MKKMLLFLTVAVLLLSGCDIEEKVFSFIKQAVSDSREQDNPVIEPDIKPEETTDTETKKEFEEMEIHFIDVGQGDATLISCGDEHMLIDAGENDKGTLVQLYLQKRNIKTLKYVIGTHPDSDHYGGLDVIITKFNCENIILPTFVKDTRTCEDVYNAIEYKRSNVINPMIGDEYTLGSATITVVAPSKTYEDANNSSIAVLVKNGDFKALFTGDMEEAAESDLLSLGYDLDVDIYKVGHHGSKTSTDETLLEKMSPMYAVISCGEDNEYGHPHAETLNKLRSNNVSTFRTDEQGSIVCSIKEDNIYWYCAPSTSWKAGE